MPVTAKLSKHFYERLGDEIANELVDWFNQVDIAYKSDLREMNELNYARFEAKLDQRLAEFRAELKGDIAGLRTEFNERFDGLRLDVNSTIGGAATEIQKAFKEQYKVFFLAWATLFVGVLGAIIPLYFR